MHAAGYLALAVALAIFGFSLGELVDRVCEGRAKRTPSRKLDVVAAADQVWVNDCDRPFRVVTTGSEGVVVEGSDGQRFRLTTADGGTLVLVRAAARYPDGGVRVRHLRAT